MARQANLAALDAMIGAARAGGKGVPYLAGLAADLGSLASRTATATAEMREQLAGTSGADNIAATLTAMRDAAIGISDALRQPAGATVADPKDPGAARASAGNAANR